MEYLVVDDRFKSLHFGNSRLEKLWTGTRWAEGPVYVPAGKYLLWSDIPNDRAMRFDETDGSVSEFQKPSMNSNGQFIDHEGRVVRCEHRGRCISRIEHDGSRRVLASTWEGKRLNSPNDVLVKSDRSIWFTDPTYGIDHDYEGDQAESEIGAANVYRLDVETGIVTAVVTDMLRPNGLTFSPDESLLYVVDTGITHDPTCTPKIRVYDVRPDGASVSNGQLFTICDAGVFDGIRADVHGNVWAAAGDGIHCFDKNGTLLGKVLVPEVCSNFTFGGPKFNRMYICASTSLYSVYLNTRGVTLWK